MYLCLSCQSSFATDQELGSHYEAHLANQFFSCETCGEQCADGQSYIRHLQKHMEKPVEEESNNGISFPCPICDKSFTTMKSLKRHVECVHAKIKDHGCPLCEKKFSRSDHLKLHLLRHSGKKPHQCGTCGMSFIDGYSLNQHCRMHVRQQIAMSRVLCQGSKARSRQNIQTVG